MSETESQRVDEVSRYYKSARALDTACGYLFYISAILSGVVLFPDLISKYGFLPKLAFVLLSVILFGAFVVSKLWLVPKAERMRRRQLLANSLGTPITYEQTKNYYNNEFSPSLLRLAASLLENSFFGKEVSEKMLLWVRLKTGLYFCLWVGLLAARFSSMDTILWITQVVFSADVLAYWLTLETLNHRYCRVYDDLYSHFLQGLGDETAQAKASILDSFVAYESAKAVAGVLLDSKIFHRENARLSQEWQVVRSTLRLSEMADQSRSQ